MNNSHLYQALLDFKGAQGKEENLITEFNKIAEAAFHSGYFIINNGTEQEYKIEITCIEFYYHEDDGYIKDEKKYLKGKEEFGYQIGAICPNPSGIDVLFDSPQKEYHASFLIRGYKAVENGICYENNKKSKTWNTQDLWYDLFGGANMLNKGRFSIEWINNDNYQPNIFTPHRIERINLHDGRLWGYTKYKL